MSVNEDNKTCIGILTVSDRCASGETTDTSGQNLSKLIEDGIIPTAKVTASGCVSDDQNSIVEALQHWADNLKLHLILTTGGTGFSARDVTPEAVREVIHREAPGLSLLMLSSSLRVTPLAALSRPVCGIRTSTLIVTLPGSAKGAEECLRFLAPVIPHAIDLLAGREGKVEMTHQQLQGAGVQMAVDDAGVGVMHDAGMCLAAAHHQVPMRRHHRHRHGHDGGRHLHHGGLGGHHYHDAHLHHHHLHGDHPTFSAFKSYSHSSSPVEMTDSKAEVSPVSRRHRKSPYPMISVEEAQQIVFSHSSRLTPFDLHVSEAVGFVLAEEVIAEDPLPPFAASVKDGYAVVANDGEGSRRVLGGVVAGDKIEGVVGVTVTSGSCVRINTGAPVPNGADAVVQVEDTELIKSSSDGCEELEINIMTAPVVGQDIRPVGSDVLQGQRVLEQGTYIGPAEVGIAASVGAANLLVYRKPLVGLLSTGNELQRCDDWPLQPGHVYDSNLPTLAALLRHNAVSHRQAPPVGDTPRELKSAIMEMFDAGVDVLVTTGGVSMGERDLVRPVLEADFAATIHFAQVFMKPGKPTTFASLRYRGRARLVLGLPGNPVSATVTAHLFLLPLCRRMAGRQDALPPVISAKLQHSVTLDPRPEYHRATLTFPATCYASDGGVTEGVLPLAASTGRQESSRLLSCCRADSLLLLPPRMAETTVLEEGSTVRAMLLQ